jgi:hypothetical protein
MPTAPKEGTNVERQPHEWVRTWAPRVAWIMLGFIAGIFFQIHNINQDAADSYVTIGGFEYRLVPMN